MEEFELTTTELDGRILGNSANQIPALRIFPAFLRLGMTAFGGPAMVAYIRELAVIENRWVSEQSLADGAALCQSIPGATAMQTAAYTGLRAGGPLGAFVALRLKVDILWVVLAGAAISIFVL